MKDFKFNSEDFKILAHTDERVYLAKKCNAKLDEWLSTGVKVYSSDPKIRVWDIDPELEYDTHEALLINIKPIERECAHSPVNIDEAAEMLKWTKRKNAYFIPCYKCGRTLVPKWSVVGDK